VSVEAVWIVNDATPSATVYALAKTLFNPANRDTLDQGPPSAQEVALSHAALSPPAPLHQGALRFYREENALLKR
jgi:TRAP-type uncharacterized transport system substrate-binding protein